VTQTVLPDAEWLSHPGLIAVIDALRTPKGNARLVGGAVRDSLLGLAVSDIDLATPLLPKDVIDRLEAKRIKAVPTGIEHGTITAVSHDKTFEVTTLRRDVSTDGRRATVEFSENWAEDAARRDFTINALYADPETREIYDYFSGQVDLEKGLVRFIGDAEARIAEDHLRILRFFRFYARFGRNDPDNCALQACSKAASSLMALSRERIADELIKLLSLSHPETSIALMCQGGIFSAFLPEIATDASARLVQLIKRENSAHALPNAGRRLNAILPEDVAIVETVAARLKLSNRLRTELAARLTDCKPSSTDARALAYRLGINLARDLFLLHGDESTWMTGYAALDGWEPPAFPIKGGQLVEKGLDAGPLVAKTLQAIERQWIEEGFPDANRAAEIADQAVVTALSLRNA